MIQTLLVTQAGPTSDGALTASSVLLTVICMTLRRPSSPMMNGINWPVEPIS